MAGIVGFLSRAEPAASERTRADAVFVFAGSQLRKEFAARSWPAHAAPALVLSVGRFEWRRYERLGLPGMEALRKAVEATPPPERHFFVIRNPERVEVVRVRPRPFGTWNEMSAFARLARERGWRSLVLVSSAFHLRRVALTARRAFQGWDVSLAYAAPPASDDPYAAGRWWRSPRGVRVIAAEILKLIVYAALLRTARAGRRFPP